MPRKQQLDRERGMTDNDPFHNPLPTAECPLCGEAMEGVRAAGPADADAQAIFRCRNGHTVVVELVEEYEDDNDDDAFGG